MKTFFLISFFLAISFLITAQDYQSYKFVHPKPQANNLRKIQMLDLNNWFSVGANGTFMRTSNAGVDWYFHHKAGRYSNSALAIGQNYSLWFFNSNYGFVVGDRGYIGRTNNGGVSFDSVGIGIIPVAQRGNDVWFANQDTGFVAAGSASGSSGTVARTTDGGATWTSVLTTSFSVLAINGVSSEIVYAVSSDGSVFKTTNAGQNWNSSGGVVGQFMYGMDFLDQNTGFVGGGSGGMSRTTNAGITWTSLSPPQTNWSFFQVKAISETEIYAVGDPFFLWKSTDLGNTWSSIQISPLSGPASTFIWYSMDKIGNTIVLSGDYGVVAKSENNGASWSSNHYSLTTQLIFDMAKVPETNKIFAVGRQFNTGTRQLFASTNGGINWTTQDLLVNFDASSISMVNSQVGYISGTNSQVLKTTDGGNSWNSVTQPTTGSYNLYSIEFVNPDTGWVFVNFLNVPGGNIFKTTNGGQSWTQQTNGLTNSIYSADMVNENIGYHTINSSSRPVYKTTDGGTTWNPITTPLTGIIRTVKALDANNLYIAASSGTTRMARSSDGGINWTPISLPITVDITSMGFVDADTGYVCGNATTVVGRTTDKGLTWSFENLHLPTLTKVAVLPGDIVFAFGTYGSILKYDPKNIIPVELASFTASVSGSNVTLRWVTGSEVNNSGFDVERSKFKIQNSTVSGWEKIGFVDGKGTTTESSTYSFVDNNLVPGSYHYRIKQIDFDGSVKYYNLTENIEIGLPNNFELAQNYPNPFNPTTIINFTIPSVISTEGRNLRVQLKVYDVLGNEVATLVDGFKEAGYHSVEFNAAGLSSGIYLYRLTTGDFISSKKMMILK